jgi:hypothetical protein
MTVLDNFTQLAQSGPYVLSVSMTKSRVSVQDTPQVTSGRCILAKLERGCWCTTRSDRGNSEYDRKGRTSHGSSGHVWRRTQRLNLGDMKGRDEEDRRLVL